MLLRYRKRIANDVIGAIYTGNLDKYWHNLTRTLVAFRDDLLGEAKKNSYTKLILKYQQKIANDIVSAISGMDLDEYLL